jgi:hypothetical protein
MREDSAFLINHELRSRGLSSLDEAGALIPQLAMFVRDHAHLRSLINACDAEERGHMYEALVPNLRFKAKPLHLYLIEMAEDAARRQLPTIGPDGGLVAYKPPPEIVTEADADAAIATAAVTADGARHHLRAICARCTREAVFPGITKNDCVQSLRQAGWVMTYVPIEQAETIPELKPVEMCPECAL